MTWRSTFLLAISLSFPACSHHVYIQADSMSIPHPDDPSRKVEYFLEKPAGKGPWPAVVFIHGYQQSPRAGARDFVRWGVLANFAKRGYLAVAVSQPGYGGSSGPADFCGPFTQHAVSAVIGKLRRDGDVVPHKVVIEGISRGALVAGLVAAHDPSIAGVVLISGLYDLPPFLAGSKSIQAELMANFTDETGGGSEALRQRSVLNFAGDIKAAALIINGAQDDRTDPSQARRLADEIVSHGGKARAIIYPNYGHQIPVEVRDKEINPFIDKLLLSISSCVTDFSPTA
jgi:dipeptidyl aminopeptidase/acylaminoacyl peptidase